MKEKWSCGTLNLLLFVYCGYFTNEASRILFLKAYCGNETKFNFLYYLRVSLYIY